MDEAVCGIYFRTLNAPSHTEPSDTGVGLPTRNTKQKKTV